MSESMRAFVAIELSEEMRQVLTDLIARLKKGGLSSVRWVNPEAVHLTLKFLGNISSAKAEKIADALSASVSGSGPFDLSLGDAGVFPSQAAARVLWVGLRGDLEALETLQQGVEKALESLGFSREKRRFTAHLTLGRLNERAISSERRRAAETLLKVGPTPEATMKVQSVSLMQSTLLPSGAVYTRLASIPMA